MYSIDVLYSKQLMDLRIHPQEPDPRDPPTTDDLPNRRYLGNDTECIACNEFIRPSYCIKCKYMTGHNTPSRLVVIRNGRPAMSSFCWTCRSRKIRLVSHTLYERCTGKKVILRKRRLNKKRPK
ncbi:uncharacterized protein LOC126899491 [Daktulosphaira vitifoliae]|uniref:uncharacterized protein LOC126899491 n=1 Tax=Daktulosphaira vitifoliae TaxID=58002 RepID=UPI0021AAA1C6|nr:uncharacterized protein LOC126899491 [Daktulosphaira vitifoliae]